MLPNWLIVERTNWLLEATIFILIWLSFQRHRIRLEASLGVLVLSFFWLGDGQCEPVDIAALLRIVLIPLLQHYISLVLFGWLLGLLLDTGPEVGEAAACFGFSRLGFVHLLRLVGAWPERAEVTGLLARVLSLGIGLTWPESARMMGLELLVATACRLTVRILLHWGGAPLVLASRIGFAVGTRRLPQRTSQLVRLVLEAASELLAHLLASSVLAVLTLLFCLLHFLVLLAALGSGIVIQ